MDFKILYKKGMGAEGADLLLFEGSLSVRNVQAIKKSLLAALSDGQALQVKVQNADALDFSFLQVLISLKLKFSEEKRPICFDMDLDEEHHRILAASGLNELLLVK